MKRVMLCAGSTLKVHLWVIIYQKLDETPFQRHATPNFLPNYNLQIKCNIIGQNAKETPVLYGPMSQTNSPMRSEPTTADLQEYGHQQRTNAVDWKGDVASQVFSCSVLCKSTFTEQHSLPLREHSLRPLGIQNRGQENLAQSGLLHLSSLSFNSAQGLLFKDCSSLPGIPVLHSNA